MLEEYTDEFLQAVLDHRKKEREEAKKPKPLPFMNFVPLTLLCQDHIDKFDPYRRSEWLHEIYEAAMEAVFGPEIWAWINDQS